jgi:hypothetical protein
MGRLPVVPEPWSPWCPSLEYEGNGKRAGADKLGKEFERLWAVRHLVELVARCLGRFTATGRPARDRAVS